MPDQKLSWLHMASLTPATIVLIIYHTIKRGCQEVVLCSCSGSFFALAASGFLEQSCLQLPAPSHLRGTVHHRLEPDAAVLKEA